MPAAVSIRGVSKRYRIFPSQSDRFKQMLSFGRVRRGHEFWALRDIDLEVERGTTLGILGRNGAGKSTLLKIVSGVLQPTSGTVEVNGRLAALLQLGAGFNPEFTGRENVMLNGLILGLDRREMLERFDEIAEFADIGEFMEQPVKTYSSGMRARLGFAVAVSVEPDILIVDETLSVGDAIFKHLGLRKMRELRDAGTTIFFVSHSPGMVKNFCNEAVLLHKGAMIAHGATAEVADRYGALLSGLRSRRGDPGSGLDPEANEDDAPDFKEDPALERRAARVRHGTGEARVSNVELLDASGGPTQAVAPDEPATVRVHLEYAEDVKDSAVGITLRNKAGLDVFSTTTAREGVRVGPRRAGERLIVDFSLKMPLRHGPYSVAAAVSHPKEKDLHMDWVDVAAAFRLERLRGRPVGGLVDLPTAARVHSPDRAQDGARNPGTSA